MKTIKAFAIFISAIGILCIFTSNVTAGRGCDSPTGVDPSSYINMDKNAPGTKYDATLTIYYETDASCGCDGLTNMYFFLRIEGNMEKAIDNDPNDPGTDDQYLGMDLKGFGGVAGCIPWWGACGYNDEQAAEAQQTALEEFFRLWVVPEIYDCEVADCPTAKVKSVNKIIEDGAHSGSDLLFIIMDLVIAIDD